MLDQRTVEILAQVVFKEMSEDQRQGKEFQDFWKSHQEQTLELARNIIRINKTINP